MKSKFIVVLLFFVFTLNAQNSKLKTLENERKAKMAQIDATSKILDQTKKSKKNALNTANLLSKQITDRKQVINILNNEIKTLDEDIISTEEQISILEREIKFKKANYVKSLQSMSLYRSNVDQLLFIFSAEDFAQSYRRIRYLKEYSSWQKEQSIEIENSQRILEQQKNKSLNDKNDKISLVQEREKETNKLKNEESAQQKEIKELTKREKDLAQELSKQKKQAQALNNQIERIIAEEIARAQAEAERARKANEKKSANEKKEVTREAETSGGYAMTKKEQALSSSFAGNKGHLPFPLKGSYKIVSHYGEQQHQSLKYVKTVNNGIDIQTIPNTEARSVFEGQVSKIFIVPGYNNSIIVRHGNYLTVYCNISEVYVKQGDYVKTGQVLGKIFTDYDDGNVTLLHFEIWKERNKLNPEPWLN